MTSTLQAPPRPRVGRVGRVTVRVRAAGTDSLYRNSFMLMANTAVQTALGAVFWLVAARRYSEADVGVLTATLSAVVLVSTASCLGFPNALVRYLPRNPGRTGEIALTSTTVAVVCAMSLFGLSLLTPWALPLVRGGASAELVVLGVATVAASVLGMVCDAVFVAQRSSHLLLGKSTLGGITKVAAVLLLPAGGVADLALANLAGLLAAVALTIALLLPRLSRPLRLRRSALTGTWSFSIGNHAGMIFGILPITATPLIVLAARGAREAAFFGMAMMLLGLLNVVPAMLSQSLYAELSADPDQRRAHIHKAARAIYLILVPCAAALVLAAPLVLGAFGPAYASGATGCLRWMAVGSLVAGLSYLVDVCVNSLGRASSYVVLNASNAFLVLVAVAVAAPNGLTAVGVAWLVAQTASVLVAVGVLALVQPTGPAAREIVPAPAASAPRRPSTRLPFLDGLRGVAAAFVVLSHSWSTVYVDARGGRTTTQLLTSWLGLGHYAVSVFIVISGFSLGLVAWRGGLGWPGGMRAFFRGRFRRIVATYWAAVALGAGLGATVLAHPVGTLWDGAIPVRTSGVIVHALLLQDLVWAGPAGSTAFWSLAVEWHIYLAFPLLLLLLRRRPGLWLAPIVGAGAICAVAELSRATDAGSWLAGLHPSLYALFVLGIVTARQAAQATDRTARRRHETQLWMAAGWGLLLAVLVTTRGLDPVSPVHDLWFGPLAALLIGRLADPSSRGRVLAAVRRLLSRRALVWLGTISYSLYLIHAAVIESVWRVAVRPWAMPEPWPLVLEATLGLGASVVGAAVFYRLVERRFTAKPPRREGPQVISNQPLTSNDRLTSNYRAPRSFYLAVAARVSMVRSAWYSLRFKGIVLVGRGTRVHIHRTASVRLAPGAMLMFGLAHDTPTGTVVRLRPRAVLEISGRVQVMRGATLTVGYDARLHIGGGTFLNDGAAVVCDQEVSIGRDCAISWGARILDTDVHQLVRGGAVGARRAPVSLGDHCWVGAGAMVLKGVQLGRDCVVGAGAVVTRSAGPGELLVGSPACRSAEHVSWVP